MDVVAQMLGVPWALAEALVCDCRNLGQRGAVASPCQVLGVGLEVGSTRPAGKTRSPCKTDMRRLQFSEGTGGRGETSPGASGRLPGGALEWDHCKVNRSSLSCGRVRKCGGRERVTPGVCRSPVGGGGSKQPHGNRVLWSQGSREPPKALEQSTASRPILGGNLGPRPPSGWWSC